VEYKGNYTDVDVHDDDSEEHIDINVEPITFSMNATEDERLEQILNASYAPYQKIHSKKQQKKKIVKRKKKETISN